MNLNRLYLRYLLFGQSPFNSLDIPEEREIKIIIILTNIEKEAFSFTNLVLGAQISLEC